MMTDDERETWLAIRKESVTSPELQEATCGSIFAICLRLLAMPCGRSTAQSLPFWRDSSCLDQIAESITLS